MSRWLLYMMQYEDCKMRLGWREMFLWSFFITHQHRCIFCSLYTTQQTDQWLLKDRPSNLASSNRAWRCIDAQKWACATDVLSKLYTLMPELSCRHWLCPLMLDLYLNIEPGSQKLNLSMPYIIVWHPSPQKFHYTSLQHTLQQLLLPHSAQWTR